METPTAAVPVVPVAAAQPAQVEGRREERSEIEAPHQPTKLQAEMSRQPRSISEHYKGSGKLQDKARARAGGDAVPKPRRHGAESPVPPRRRWPLSPAPIPALAAPWPLPSRARAATSSAAT